MFFLTKMLFHNIHLFLCLVVHAHNFQKYPRNLGSSFGKPYDYDSVMHYSKYAFAKNRNIPTIVPTYKKAVIGQRFGLSLQDRKEIDQLYRCKGEAGILIGFHNEPLTAAGICVKSFLYHKTRDQLFLD